MKLTSILFILFILTPLNIFASSNSRGALKGVIIDINTAETLIGATVTIEGTSFGTAANLEGEFNIQNIPAGSYNIVVRYLGYKNEIIESTISEGETTELNIKLSPESIQAEEVIVTAQAKGQMAAINQERSASGIVNVVSSDKIKEVPDVNAAESIGRLSGVSLKRSGGEGNSVMIRGLQPQFSIVEIDGVRMTGTGNDRGVGLAALSSEMLDGIELSKSLTADKDADAIGGIVNLRTATAVDSFHTALMVRGGYNDLETSLRDYKVAGSISNRWLKGKLGALLNISHERVNRSSDRLTASYAVEPSRVDTDPNFPADSMAFISPNAANIQEQKSIRHRTNGNIVFDYKTKNVKIKFNNMYSRMSMDNELRNSQFRFGSNDFKMIANRSQPIEQIQQHSLDGDFKIIGTDLHLKYAHTRTSFDSDVDTYDMEDDQPFRINPETGEAYESIPIFNRYFSQPKEIIDRYYALGEYGIPSLRNNIRDTISRNDITNIVNADWKIPFALNKKLSGKIKVGFKYSDKKRKSDRNSIQTNFSNGGIGNDRMNNIMFVIHPDLLTANDIGGDQQPTGIPVQNFLDEDYEWGEVLNGDYQQSWSPDIDKLQRYHNEYYEAETSVAKYDPNGIFSSNQDYEVSEKLTAAYIMAEIKFGTKITLLPGVRYEKMQTEYTSNYVIADPFAPSGIQIGYPLPVSVNDRMNENFYPSVNLKIEASKALDVRAAYYESTARPNYLLLSPGITSDQNRLNMNAYNPYLRPSTAHNFDLGISFFKPKIGLFSIYYFHKELTDLLYRLPKYQPRWFDQLVVGDGPTQIPASLYESLQKPRELYPEDFIDPSNNTRMNNFPINNPNKAVLDGIELSWQTNFWYLPGILSGIVLDLNYTYITSTYEVPFIDFIQEVGPPPLFLTLDIPVYATSKEPMPDQPNQIFNARIGWDYKGFSTRLSFRYETETQIGFDFLNDMANNYRASIFRMDLNAALKLKKGFSITLDLMNLNNQMDGRYFNSYVGRISDYVRFDNNIEHYGMTAQLGIKYVL